MSTNSEIPIESYIKGIQNELSRIDEKIESWGRYNSQSNPGAVMELRDMKSRRVKIVKLLKIAQDAEHRAPE